MGGLILEFALCTVCNNARFYAWLCGRETGMSKRKSDERRNPSVAIIRETLLSRLRYRFIIGC